MESSGNDTSRKMPYLRKQLTFSLANLARMLSNANYDIYKGRSIES